MNKIFNTSLHPKEGRRLPTGRRRLVERTSFPSLQHTIFRAEGNIKSPLRVGFAG